MKFTTAMALGMAHQALGKAVHNVYPVRRDVQERQVGSVSVNGVVASQVELDELFSRFGLSKGSGIDINVLWVNVGGGAATTVLGQASTVTVTETVAGAAGTVAPVAGVPGEVAASPTQVAGANPVVGATGATHSVTVGGPQGFAFSPPQLQANVGDVVVFDFLAQNHTVTQSAFETPCDPLAGGMDSGYQANPNNTVNPPPQVAMQVMVGTPLWFYCAQGNHCGKGMVFSINPSADKTHAMFQELAIQQRGPDGGSAITGGTPPAADPAAAPPAAAPPVAAPPAGAPPAAVAPPAAGASGVVTGVGTVAPDGSCICAVTCNFDQGFPVAAQGVGSFGGMGGMVPVQPLARR